MKKFTLGKFFFKAACSRPIQQINKLVAAGGGVHNP
jgi:hypothetical protein